MILIQAPCALVILSYKLIEATLTRMIVVVAGLSLTTLIPFLCIRSHASGTPSQESISLIGSAPCYCAQCAQLLHLHVLYQVTKLDILFHELHILSLNSLQVAHSVLKLLIQFSHTTFVYLLHLAHLLLNALHQLLLLLVVASTSPFNQR